MIVEKLAKKYDKLSPEAKDALKRLSNDSKIQIPLACRIMESISKVPHTSGK